MNQTAEPRLGGLTLRMRLSLAVLGMGLLVLLLVARNLTPDESGQGTHRQLGLPPCTFVVLFDTRCPTCGMTTAWAHLVRGHVILAVGANVGGALLAALAIVAAPWLLVAAVGNRVLGRLPSDGVLAATAVIVVVVTLIDWTVRVTSG